MKIDKGKKKLTALEAVRTNTVEIELPYGVKCLFPQNFKCIEIFGDRISFGEDYVTVEEVREGLEWLAGQFDGKIKWKREKKDGTK